MKPRQRRVYPYLNINKHLSLDISQKLAEKFLLQNNNSFAELITNKVQVINSNLIIEQTPDYLVSEVHKERGYFTYRDDSGKLASIEQVRALEKQLEK